ncbi:hypothetical protein RI129_011219 [Pyrocoelia pectoralis]|uniref:Uncharacterized protein n=1 Tax=Pyrocoelia pectoralis TaxID=417401 RepID=A0AAN7V524_9COLE
MRILIATVLFSVLGLSYVSTAPSANALALPSRKDDLAERFIDFLKEDGEFQNVIKHVAFEENHLERRRRQADRDIDGGDMEVDNPKPGFFDRAAKFVTELLQRFLKWVNSNDDRK